MLVKMKDIKTGKVEYYTGIDLILDGLAVVVAFAIVFGGLGLFLYLLTK